jgi:arylsulfatase A-like enzyme
MPDVPESPKKDHVNRRDALKTLGLAGLGAAGLGAGAAPGDAPEQLQRTVDEGRNMVFILSDDHRYDFMSFMDEPGTPDWLETPAMDRMAEGGAHLENAFVSTSLCSPSRASVLTGKYPHQHEVVDNQHLVPDHTTFFAEYLQDAGYETAYVGKWHMGRSSAEPRKGFDHWVSFRGQGSYFNPTLNVNGEQVEREGYTTDILTEYALDWLEERRDSDKPFFLYLSHKAVHHGFVPAPRHEDEYADVEIDYPETMPDTEETYAGKPEWVEEQRDSMHGVDWVLHGNMEFEELYKRYSETLLALDDSIGAVLDHLDENDLAEETLAMYMGDNGFFLGEHGFIDKRSSYEESIRVPLLAYAPGMIEPGTVVERMISNVDIAPTILQTAGLEVPGDIEGYSFAPLLQGADVADWREAIFYEYFWEAVFPQQPTQFAWRTDRYKYIWYYGAWSDNELYDLQEDPKEQNNLIGKGEKYQKRARRMQNQLFDFLKRTDGMQIPLRQPPGWQGGGARRPEDAPKTSPDLQGTE